MDFAIQVRDPSGQATRDIQVRAEDRSLVEDLVEVLVEVMEWPRQTLGGERINYALRKLNSSSPFGPKSPVGSIGLRQGDVVVLGMTSTVRESNTGIQIEI